MTDTPKKSTATTARRPDCVTEVRRGNTVLVVSGYVGNGTSGFWLFSSMLLIISAAVSRIQPREAFSRAMSLLLSHPATYPKEYSDVSIPKCWQTTNDILARTAPPFGGAVRWGVAG